MTWMQPEAMKQAQWEITKGHLRALVVMQGSYPSGMVHEARRWEALNKMVENFISDVEGDALHE